MADDFKPVHGFYVNVAKSDGNASIFIWPLIPESVLNVAPKESGGCSITVKSANGEPSTVDVVESEAFVQDAMRRCKDLDKNLPSASEPGTPK